MSVKIRFDAITDPAVREAFQRVKEAMATPVLQGEFDFFEFTLPSALTNYRPKHGLGFVPKDVLQTSIKGTGQVTWNYSLFDQTFLDLTCTGPCVVRAFIGNYRKGTDA